MFSRLSNKFSGMLIGAVAVLALVGAGAAMASQTHAGPFASNAQTASSGASHTVPLSGTATKEPEQGENGADQELTGTVQSIDTTGQTFVLTPDNGGTSVVIAFDSQTNIEQEEHGTPFTAGAHVRVDIVKRADGSLYATEINTGTEDGDRGQDGSGDGGSGDGGSGNGGSDDGNGGQGGGSDGGGSGH